MTLYLDSTYTPPPYHDAGVKPSHTSYYLTDTTWEENLPIDFNMHARFPERLSKALTMLLDKPLPEQWEN